MPTKDTSVKGIRLADAMWREIDLAAEQAGESRNEWISKRLPWLVSRASEVGKSDKNVADSGEKVKFCG